MDFDAARYVDAEQGLVNGEIFHSREIYELELERIFARSWLFLAHDAMIPKPGDFLQTYMGEDPVVVVRQHDGSVRAFLNQCRHRGMRICRADLGNAKAFMCSFHGWTYDIGGNLIHVPHEEEAYPQPLDKSRFGPAQVAQLHNYKGFIFGNWDPTAPSFEEYLGDMAWYFDAHVDRFEGGVEPVATHKWVIGCNWKFNAEQPASDSYHGEISHASALQVLGLLGDGLPPTGPGGGPLGSQYSSPYGHGTGFFHLPAILAGPHEKAWMETVREHAVERVGEARADSIRGHGNIFPNFMFLSNGAIRVTHPRGPDEMEVWSWSFVPVMAPDEVKEEMRVDVLRTFSPGGLFEQDDAENWLEEQRILRGYMARQRPLLYTMQLGQAEQDINGLPGKTAPHVYTDEGARGMYEHWADLMSGAPWSELVERKRQRVAAAAEQEEARS
ncbi:putative 3-phenylpropionate/cinnamate dioxygenase subunit alpha [Frankia sp. Hr75.2]|nr:putative 3-phenylpropionate/cinnamate dioxygenase subunit alpha [Frankia sp. Hr75.2]